MAETTAARANWQPRVDNPALFGYCCAFLPDEVQIPPSFSRSRSHPASAYVLEGQSWTLDRTVVMQMSLNEAHRIYRQFGFF